jgi:hypothetical protein
MGALTDLSVLTDFCQVGSFSVLVDSILRRSRCLRLADNEPYKPVTSGCIPWVEDMVGTVG